MLACSCASHPALPCLSLRYIRLGTEIPQEGRGSSVTAEILHHIAARPLNSPTVGSPSSTPSCRWAAPAAPPAVGLPSAVAVWRAVPVPRGQAAAAAGPRGAGVQEQRRQPRGGRFCLGRGGRERGGRRQRRGGRLDSPWAGVPDLQGNSRQQVSSQRCSTKHIPHAKVLNPNHESRSMTASQACQLCA